MSFAVSASTSCLKRSFAETILLSIFGTVHIWLWRVVLTSGWNWPRIAVGSSSLIASEILKFIVKQTYSVIKFMTHIYDSWLTSNRWSHHCVQHHVRPLLPWRHRRWLLEDILGWRIHKNCDNFRPYSLNCKNCQVGSFGDRLQLYRDSWLRDKYLTWKHPISVVKDHLKTDLKSRVEEQGCVGTLVNEFS